MIINIKDVIIEKIYPTETGYKIWLSNGDLVRISDLEIATILKCKQISRIDDWSAPNMRIKVTDVDTGIIMSD